MNKEKERIIYKKLRKEINPKLSNLIINSFLLTPEYNKAKIILIYYPLENEINTIPLIEKALKDKKKVALPKCQNNRMDFYFLDNLSKIKKGLFNVMEPISNTIVTDFQDSICIVPGIAFDKQYNRLGYGRGFYDRFLINYPYTKIGLCYEKLLVKKISTENHDVSVDMIISEKRIITKKKDILISS